MEQAGICMKFCSRELDWNVEVLFVQLKKSSRRQVMFKLMEVDVDENGTFYSPANCISSPLKAFETFFKRQLGINGSDWLNAKHMAEALVSRQIFTSRKLFRVVGDSWEVEMFDNRVLLTWACFDSQESAPKGGKFLL